MIPSHLIFVWIGEVFPLTAQAAIYSAYRHNNPKTTILVHENLNTEHPDIKKIQKDCNLEIKEFHSQWFDTIPQAKHIQSIFNSLSKPAARSNIIRMVCLWKWGGIYLDTDTITFKSLQPLRENNLGFCGQEPILIPANIKEHPYSLKWIWIGIMLFIRSVFSFLPQGYFFFLPLEKFCYQKVNNAVIGAIPKSSFLKEYFKQISKISPKKWKKRFIFGTYALQNLVKQKPHDLTILPSSYFYPLGPEICNHWFRNNVRWKKILKKDCYLVHWYQSVEIKYLKQKINKKWIFSHPKTPFAQWMKNIFPDI